MNQPQVGTVGMGTHSTASCLHASGSCFLNWGCVAVALLGDAKTAYLDESTTDGVYIVHYSPT